jgi:hypothetical protein
MFYKAWGINPTLLLSIKYLVYTQVVLNVSLDLAKLVWCRCFTRYEGFRSVLIHVSCFQKLLPKGCNESEC